MSVDTLPGVEHVEAALLAPDLGHWVCCDDDRARCGLDVSGHVWNARPEFPCIVCEGLAAAGTPCDTPGCLGGAAL